MEKLVYCKTCLYSKWISTNGTEYSCRKNPPVAINVHGYIKTVWPTTKNDDFCYSGIDCNDKE